MGVIIKFLFLFVKDNKDNLMVMAQMFEELTKMYAYKLLPKLLAELFKQVSNPEAAFEMIFCNIGKSTDK